MSEETTTVYQSCATQFSTTDGLDGLLQCIADGSAAVRCVCLCSRSVCLFVFSYVLSLSLEVSYGLCLGGAVVVRHDAPDRNHCLIYLSIYQRT